MQKGKKNISSCTQDQSVPCVNPNFYVQASDFPKYSPDLFKLRLAQESNRIQFHAFLKFSNFNANTVNTLLLLLKVTFSQVY